MAFGGIPPNKNIPRLLLAFQLARSRFQVSHDLVIVGRLPGSVRVKGRRGVITTGYLDDCSLAVVLAGAEALIFPSLYEGFGLPVLEAMAAGVPVTCSAATAVPEVAGEAALYFDPLEIEDIALKIRDICTDPKLRQVLRAKGLARAAEFSWENCARATLAVYRRVLRSARSRSE
jgi:glycosyltransferase involved in cell wall biosynthesis